MEPPPEPPVDRPTKMRWGCLVTVVVFGILFFIKFFTPLLDGPSRSDFMTTTSLNALGIHKALMLYAADYEGRFPEGLKHSNEAFRKLFIDYLQEENPFYVPGSAWHATAPGQKPDNDIGTPPAYEKALQRGENHWAYVSGLRAESDANHPLIADGFVEGSPGTYADDPSTKGGVWKGTTAIVVLVSGSAKAMSLSPKSGFRVLRTDPATGAQTDLFSLPTPPPSSAAPKILNPE